MKISPETPQAAKEAIRSLENLFERAGDMGMNNIELQNYHSLFSEPVQLWAETAYARN
ncbi:MAG: hypothetical protein AAFR89_11470 [Cyanobacteria bacterium J06633_1]